MQASVETSPAGPVFEEVRCRPCRRTYKMDELVNAKRCPSCGGPTVTATQMESYQAATAASLTSLRQRSSWILRATAGYMLTVLIVTLLMDDTGAAAFINYVVIGTAAAAVAVTEVWSRTGSRAAMVIASLLIQAGAMVFFFTALPLLNLVLQNVVDAETRLSSVGRYGGQGALLLAVLPMAGALAAWHQYRAFSQIRHLESKLRPA